MSEEHFAPELATGNKQLATHLIESSLYSVAPRKKIDCYEY